MRRGDGGTEFLLAEGVWHGEAVAGIAVDGGSLTVSDGLLESLGGASIDASAVRAEVELGAADLAGVLTVSGAGAVTSRAGSVLTAGGLNVAADGVDLGGAIVVAGGGVFVDAGPQGALSLTGSIDVSAAAATGGAVTLLGERVTLDGAARIDASGTGGGTILVGGGWQGADVSLRNASATFVGAGVSLVADGGVGAGGTVVVWADGDTRFSGHLSATGRHGGTAEVSGKGRLAFDGSGDLGGSRGRDGFLLLDPRDIVIVGGAGADDGEVADGSVGQGDGGNSDFMISATAVADFGGTVSLQADRDIVVDASITKDNGGLTFNAVRDIRLNQSIIVTSGNTVTLTTQNGSITGGGDLVTTNTDAGGDPVGSSGSISITAGSFVNLIGTIDSSGADGAAGLDGQNAAPVNITANGVAGGGDAINLGMLVTDGGNGGGGAGTVTLGGTGGTVRFAAISGVGGAGGGGMGAGGGDAGNGAGVTVDAGASVIGGTLNTTGGAGGMGASGGSAGGGGAVSLATDGSVGSDNAVSVQQILTTGGAGGAGTAGNGADGGNAGSLSVTATNAAVDALSVTADGGDGGMGSNNGGSGGNAASLTVEATGGQVMYGNLFARGGEGGDGQSGNGGGGAAGGAVEVTASTTVSGMAADASGGDGGTTDGGSGGDGGNAGQVNLTANGSAVQAIDVESATASGGDGGAGGTGDGGSAGTVTLTANDGGIAFAELAAAGGSGGSGGAGDGDTGGSGGAGASVTVNAGMAIDGMSVTVTGGDGANGNDAGDGGNGGTANLTAGAGGAEALAVTDVLAGGGNGGDGRGSGGSGAAGGNSGSLDLQATGGGITFDSLGANGGSGGSGDGGGGAGGSGATAKFNSGGVVEGRLVTADGGTGGSAGSGGTAGSGGNAGSADLSVGGADGSVSRLRTVSASGGGGGGVAGDISGGVGGNAGTVSVVADAGDLTVNQARSTGGDGGRGSGAGFTGGSGGAGASMTLDAMAGMLTVSTDASSSGGNGQAGNGGGGAGSGGGAGTLNLRAGMAVTAASPSAAGGDAGAVMAGAGAASGGAGATLTIDSGGTITTSGRTDVCGGDSPAGQAGADGSVLYMGMGDLTADGDVLACTGPVTVDIGSGNTARFNGMLETGNLTVQSGSLGGNGSSSSPTTVGGGSSISPGNSPGTITTGSLTLQQGSSYEVDVEGPEPGTGHDQIIVNGTVTIEQATLTTNVTADLLTDLGDQLVIIANDGDDAVTGAFADLPEGASVTTTTGREFFVTYVGGDGNDVALNVVTPETTPGAELGVFRAGAFEFDTDGDGAIDLTRSLDSTTGKPLAADWNGDGRIDLAVYDDGQFFIDTTDDGVADVVFAFGSAGNEAFLADLDGDGVVDPIVFDTSGEVSTWVADMSATNGRDGAADFTVAYGIPGDRPFVADWDGDGQADLGLYRNGITSGSGVPFMQFFIDLDRDGGVADTEIWFGVPGDEPFVGDFDGDGTVEPGVFRYNPDLVGGVNQFFFDTARDGNSGENEVWVQDAVGGDQGVILPVRTSVLAGRTVPVESPPADNAGGQPSGASGGSTLDEAFADPDLLGDLL